MILQKCMTFWDYKREREKMNYQEIKRAVELVKAENEGREVEMHW